jgi:hypothetical protein
LPDRFLYYPAQLWPHKNHVGLIRVLAGMRSNDDLDIPLVLTGSRKTGYDAIAQAIAEHGLSGQVLFLGAVPFERLPALYQLSHGIIAPSLYEASSFPIFEAFATGTAVIASDIPPVRELIRNDDFLFDPRNDAEMAEKIRALWNDEVFHETAKRYSRSQREQYSWKKVAETMVHIYRDTAHAVSQPRHDETAMEKSLNARDEMIDDLRGRLAEIEKAFEACEKDRIAKEQVIQDLSIAAQKRLDLIQRLDRALEEKEKGWRALKRVLQFIRNFWNRSPNKRRNVMD